MELPEAEKLALSLCCHKDRPSIWKTIYFECLSSGKHFLEQVLVSEERRPENSTESESEVMKSGTSSSSVAL